MSASVHSLSFNFCNSKSAGSEGRTKTEVEGGSGCISISFKRGRGRRIRSKGKWIPYPRENNPKSGQQWAETTLEPWNVLLEPEGVVNWSTSNWGDLVSSLLQFPQSLLLLDLHNTDSYIHIVYNNVCSKCLLGSLSYPVVSSEVCFLSCIIILKKKLILHFRIPYRTDFLLNFFHASLYR